MWYNKNRLVNYLTKIPYGKYTINIKASKIDGEKARMKWQGINDKYNNEKAVDEKRALYGGRDVSFYGENPGYLLDPEKRAEHEEREKAIRESKIDKNDYGATNNHKNERNESVNTAVDALGGNNFGGNNAYTGGYSQNYENTGAQYNISAPSGNNYSQNFGNSNSQYYTGTAGFDVNANKTIKLCEILAKVGAYVELAFVIAALVSGFIMIMLGVAASVSRLYLVVGLMIFIAVVLLISIAVPAILTTVLEIIASAKVRKYISDCGQYAKNAIRTYLYARGAEQGRISKEIVRRVKLAVIIAENGGNKALLIVQKVAAIVCGGVLCGCGIVWATAITGLFTYQTILILIWLLCFFALAPLIVSVVCGNKLNNRVKSYDINK